MQLPQIQIQQTFASIGIDPGKPRQEIQQPRAELNLEQVPAQLEINRTPSRLEIDQSQAWEDAGLKKVSTVSREYADLGKQYALEGIARRAQEVDQIRSIEQGGNPIATIAYENMNPGRAEINVAFIPSFGSVKIQFTPTQLDLQWTRGGVKLNPELKKPIHEYTPAKVEVYLKQKQSLSIEVVGGMYDRKL